MAESPEPDSDRPTIAPFMAALAIIVVLVIAVGLFNYFGDDGLTDEQRVGQAAVAANDALQRESYPDFRQYTCSAELGEESEFLARQRDSVAKQGARYIDGVTDVSVDGDRATAKVTYHFDEAPDTKTSVATTFVREDGAWKLCSTGPS